MILLLKDGDALAGLSRRCGFIYLKTAVKLTKNCQFSITNAQNIVIIIKSSQTCDMIAQAAKECTFNITICMSLHAFFVIQ